MPVIAGLVGVAVVATAALAALLVVPVWLHPALTEVELSGVADAPTRVSLRQAQAQLQNEARTTLLQALGGLIFVAGAFATWRQVQISRHSQITERISRAVEQLAGDRMDVRTGGIYALERVANNSAEDQNTVVSILSTFVRTQVPWSAGDAADHRHDPLPVQGGPPWPGVRAGDVQIALYTIARRPRPGKTWKPFLSFCDLGHARMGNRDWSGLICQYSNLARAWMPGARLDNAYLDGTDLRQAHLVGARLTDARLTGAHLAGADLRDADLRGADLTGACLDHADLSGVRHDQRTKWPQGFAHPAVSGSDTADPDTPSLTRSE
jgi:hypothetical protein